MLVRIAVTSDWADIAVYHFSLSVFPGTFTLAGSGDRFLA
jgi:hypothetical protein